MKLSVIVSVYNEKNTIEDILSRVRSINMLSLTKNWWFFWKRKK